MLIVFMLNNCLQFSLDDEVKVPVLLVLPVPGVAVLQDGGDVPHVITVRQQRGNQFFTSLEYDIDIIIVINIEY